MIKTQTNNPTFVDLYVSNQVKAEDILNYISLWHETNYELELHQFLGFEFDEYMLFVDSDQNLVPLLESKRKKKLRSQLKLVTNNQ